MLKQKVPPRLRQQGLSLVEMMVGIAVGLFVVAGAALLVSTQLNDNRRLLNETQLQQDLRASADIVTRELRRAGYWPLAERGVATAFAPAQPNTYLSLTTDATGIAYTYKRPDGSEGFQFRLVDNVIRSNIGGGLQELTDKNVLLVDGFTITDESSTPVRLPCAKICPNSPPQPIDHCWPTVQVRAFAVTIAASAAGDPTVHRTVQSRLRLRNDEVLFNGTNPAAACPA